MMKTPIAVWGKLRKKGTLANLLYLADCAAGGWYQENIYFKYRVHSRPLAHKLLWALAWLPLALGRRALALALHRLEFTRVELPVTTVCSLRCRDCANLIPFYPSPAHGDTETLLQDADAFLALVNQVHSFAVLGGEPFLHPNFLRIVEHLLQSPKIALLHIITNGTILPSEKVFRLLQHKKIVVQVSNYPAELTKNKSALLAKLQEHRINFVYAEGHTWTDFGGFAPVVGTSPAALDARFNRCATKRYHTLIAGEFHLCPRSAHGSQLGQFPPEPGDAVRFRSRPDRRQARAELKALLQKPHLAACAKCLGGVGSLPPAIQLPKPFQPSLNPGLETCALSPCPGIV